MTDLAQLKKDIDHEEWLTGHNQVLARKLLKGIEELDRRLKVLEYSHIISKGGLEHKQNGRDNKIHSI